jgi:hypothetical protein
MPRPLSSAAADAARAAAHDTQVASRVIAPVEPASSCAQHWCVLWLTTLPRHESYYRVRLVAGSSFKLRLLICSDERLTARTPACSRTDPR